LHLHRGRNKKELEKMYYLALEKLSPANSSENFSHTLSLSLCNLRTAGCMVQKSRIFARTPVTAAKLGDIMKLTSCI